MILLITILTVCTNFILGVISYRKNPKNASHVLLAIMTCLVSVWAIFNYFSLTVDSEPSILFWIRAVMFVTTYLILVIHLLLIVFPSSELKISKKRLSLLLAVTIIVSLINASPYAFQSVNVVDGTITPETGPAVAFFAAFAFYGFGAGAKNLLSRSKKYKGLKKAQVRLFYLGWVLTFSLMILTNFVMVILFQRSDLVVVGPLFSLILIGFIFYSIVKHRFFGLRFVFGKSLSYFIMAIYVYAAFYLVSYLHNQLWGSIYEPYAYISGVLLVIVFLYIYKILYEGFSTGRFLKFLFLYGPIEARDVFIRKVSSEIQLEKLLVTIIAELAKIFRTKNIGTILFDANSHKVIHELYKGEEWEEAPFSNGKRDLLNLAEYWRDGHSPIFYVEEIDKYIEKSNPKYAKILNRVGELMRRSNIEVILPLNRRIKQNGFIFLGEKGNKDAYNIEDFEILESIIGFTGVAVQNSIAHKELQSNLSIVKNFNETLQMKVDQATEDLEEKVADLREARRKERDMLDIMGHELRTPLSIIKVNLGSIKDQILNKNKQGSFEKGNKYLARIEEALEREIVLLETMISSTKIDSHRMEMHLEDVNIVKSIKSSLSTFSLQAKEKGIVLKFEEPKKEVYVYADKVRLGEVLDNLLGNAVKFTNEGSVEVFISRETDFVKVSIKDTGLGIPDHEIKNLGKKFYRVGQYINKDKQGGVVRPGGTGLGLYVSFGLIKLMGGKYEIQSEKGVGSTFSFTIPVYNLQPKAESRFGDVKNVFEKLKMKK